MLLHYDQAANHIYICDSEMTSIKSVACNFKFLHVKCLQAELKTLQEIASPSFDFAKDLMKHNLVRLYRHNIRYMIKSKILVTNKRQACVYSYTLGGTIHYNALRFFLLFRLCFEEEKGPSKFFHLWLT